ncbi:MAG: hypothetical protein ACE5ID_09980, partial [Acidobacteriota bacterium]
GANSPPGEIYLPPESVSRSELDRMAAELHLPVRPLGEAPHGSAYKVHQLRTGLFKPWRASMDEGWTRWLLEQYEFPFVNLSNSDVRSGKGLGDIDVLLLPDLETSIIVKGERDESSGGRSTPPLPPPYDGGIGEEGREKIKDWVLKEGGTIVALDSSADFVIDLLDLPVKNIMEGVEEDRFLCPGSMLRLLVDPTQPLAYGMRREEAGYFAASPAFSTRIPDGRFNRRVVAWYPQDRRDILLSGYILGADLLERRAAVVELEAGDGRIILIGFRAQHRAQPVRTFKLLFNALYRSGLEKSEL